MKKVRTGIAILLEICMLLSLVMITNVSADNTEQVIYDSDSDFATYTTKDDLYNNTNWSDGDFEHWDEVGLKVNKDTSENAEYPNYLTVIGNHSAKYTLAQPVSSGKLRISAAVRIPEAHSGLIDVTDTDGTSPWLIGFYGSNVLNTLYNSDQAKKFLNYIPNEWYDFSIVFDLDAKTYSIQQKNGGNVIWAYRDLPLSIWNAQEGKLGKEMESITSIRFRQWGSTLDIGKLKIEKIQQEKDSDFVLCSEDFEKVTNDNLANHGIEAWWAAFSDVAEIKVPTGESSKMLTVANDKHVGKKIPALESGKKYKFSYTEKLSTSRLYLNILKFNDSGSDSLILPWASGNAAYCQDHETNTSAKLGDVKDGDLVRFEAIYDSARKTIECSVFNAKTGEQIGSTVKTNVPDSVVDYIIGSDRSLHISKWGGGETYIDDFKLEYYVERPNLSDEKVSMTDYKDNPIEINAQTETITPAIKQIKLDFGTKIEESSLEGAVTLKKKSDGSVVGFTSSLSEAGVYTITLSKMLEQNTEYVLSADKKISNENGYAMLNSFTTEFTTGNINSVVKLSNATVDGQTATLGNASQSGKQIVIDTELVNADSAKKDLVYILTYYKNNTLLNADVKSAEAQQGAISAETQSFDIPSNVSDADTIKVFLWNTSKDMKAYCEPIVINK